MNQTVIASIVEGHGEVEALPVLLRRLAPDCAVARPVRVKRQRVVRDGELERYAAIADANIKDRGGVGGVLLLLDADDDCAATVGPTLLRRLTTALPHRLVACVLAVREYESWLVAGLDGPRDASDETRGRKGWLAERYGSYIEAVDQPKLTSRLNIEAATERSRSFRHLRQTIERIRGLHAAA